MIVDQLKIEQRAIRFSDNAGLTLTQKHQDLLSVTRKLVVPAKYKALVDMANHIDMSLNFLKSRRDKAEFVAFKDVALSVAQTQGKTCQVSHFRQILSLASELYEHKWVINPKIS
jgi:3-dehydroquinate synthetase